MLLAVLVLACSEPALDVPPGGTPALVAIDPVRPAAELPAHFRARVQGAAPAEPWLVQGAVSDYHERAVRRGELPSALGERAVPLRYWAHGSDVELQPLAWLEPGEEYSLVALGRGVLGSWTVERAAARATQLFPAPGRPVSRVQVLCAEGLVAPAELVLSPTDVGVSARSSTENGTSCVTFQLVGEPTQPSVLPPAVGDVLLAPALFVPVAAARPVACSSGQQLDDACFEVTDDSLLVTPLTQDVWWHLDAPEARSVVTQVGERAVLLDGLGANQAIAVRGRRLGADGVEHAVELGLTTAPPRQHLVLNEVLANPLGAEPDSEWIELVNDSATPAALGGLWLEDGAGRSWLPDVTLEPHELALLVPAGFRGSALDAPIAPGTRLLELVSLGARGLSNSGETLLLAGPEGIAARFPLLAAPHAGRSQARRALDAADDDARAFAEHGAPGASPGAPNTFD